MPTPEDVAEDNLSTLGLWSEMNRQWSTRLFSMFKTYLESNLDEKTKQL